MSQKTQSVTRETRQKTRATYAPKADHTADEGEEAGGLDPTLCTQRARRRSHKSSPSAVRHWLTATAEERAHSMRIVPLLRGIGEEMPHLTVVNFDRAKKWRLEPKRLRR
jgi:hypothetical protein